MSLTSADNVSTIKVGRVTQQSVAMLKHIKQFINVQFKIEEVEDDVYSEDSDDEDEEEEVKGDGEDDEMSESASEKSKKEEKEGKTQLAFPKSFIFSCIGIGLTNIARKTE
jgi:hypothetical protein